MDRAIYDIFEDDLDILEIIDFGFPRLYYTRSNHFHDMDELAFFRRFRLMKQTCLRILTLIEEAIEFPTDLNNSVAPMNQLLVTLQFYASAGHLISVAEFCGMHVSTVSRIITRVSQAIASLRPQFVTMPRTAGDISAVQNDFFEIAAFPRVLGITDCTHIRIQSPGGDDAEVFRNRKGYFSINVQVVCNASLEIMDVVARWPGSAHDSTIFNNSRIGALMENGEFPNCFILGDSDYPLKQYFLTPLANTRNKAEELYNEAHIRTRNVVERLFGNWKRRFPILAYGMRIKIDTVLTVVVAAAVLQNVAHSMHECNPPKLPEDTNPQQLEELIANGQVPNVPSNNNNAMNFSRSNLINNYFGNL